MAGPGLIPADRASPVCGLAGAASDLLAKARRPIVITNEMLAVLGIPIAGILLTLYITRRRVRLGRRVGKG